MNFRPGDDFKEEESIDPPVAQSFKTAEIRSYSDASSGEESDISDEDFLEDARQLLANAQMQQDSGREEYLAACSTEKLVPSSLILDHLLKDEINLRHMLLLDKGCIALAQCLKINQYISKINLSSNGISDTGGLEIAAALECNNTIQSLDLSANKLSNRAGVGIANALRTNISLTELSVARNSLGDAFAIALADTLAFKGTPAGSAAPSARASLKGGQGGGGGGGLRAVDVSGNQIGRRGGERLAAVFEVHDARLPGVLDLGWNDLGPAGPALLAAALNAPRLRRLAVPFNGLADRRGGALADVWETYLKHSSLIHLDISRNRLGPETAQGIATALKENHNLQVLMIGWNPLGTEGTNALLQSLEENKTLEILRVENTCDNGQEAAAVERADEIMLRREILTTIVCEYPERERARVSPAAAARPPLRASLLARLPAGVAAELASPRLSRMTERSPRK